MVKIGVIGDGFVGHAVSEGFKSHGFEVKVWDKFKESNYFEEVERCDFIFICVPTPYKDGIDLSVVDETFERLKNYRGVVVIKSTVIPGTARSYQEKYPRMSIVSNPEFLSQDTAEEDFLHPDKILIGYTSDDLSGVLTALDVGDLYKDFEAPVIILRSEETEMVKYMVNAYYALRVTFANEIYDICEDLGVNYDRVRGCFELDKRVAPGHFDVFHGGYRGFGGKCLPKDLAALNKVSNSTLLKTVQKINDRRLGKEIGVFSFADYEKRKTLAYNEVECY